MPALQEIANRLAELDSEQFVDKILRPALDHAPDGGTELIQMITAEIFTRATLEDEADDLLYIANSVIRRVGMNR